jgi:hypothetical protein
MSLLAPQDREHLREELSSLTRIVHLVFYTQTLGCDTCTQTRQILDELPPLSDRVVIDEVNFVLEPERAKAHGITRVPAIALAYEDPASVEGAERSTLGSTSRSAPLVDTRIRFLGAPSGYEFVSLIHAVLLAGGAESQLSEASQARLRAVRQPVTMQVFSTPT